MYVYVRTCVHACTCIHNNSFQNKGFRVHSAAGGALSVGRTVFGHVGPLCAHVFSVLPLLNIRRMDREVPWRTD